MDRYIYVSPLARGGLCFDQLENKRSRAINGYFIEFLLISNRYIVVSLIKGLENICMRVLEGMNYYYL